MAADFGKHTDATTGQSNPTSIDPAKFDDVFRELSSKPALRVAFNGQGDVPQVQAPGAKGRIELAQNAAPGTDKPPYFRSTRVDPVEIEVAGHGLDNFTDKYEAWKQLKGFINKEGSDPTDAVVDAIKTSKMVGLGEVHTYDGDPNPPRDWATAHMKDFARAGTTDLFVEMPRILQPIFDRFNNDPNKGPLQIPDKIVGPDGKIIDTPAAQGALKMLRELSPDFLKMWTAARDAGIKIDAVDNDSNGWLFYDKDSPEAKTLALQRNHDMATNMLAILNQPTKPGEPPRKGIAWLGNMDVAEGESPLGIPALQEVKDQLAKTGQKTTTFFTQMAETAPTEDNTLVPLSFTVDRPVAAATHEPNGQPSILGRMGVWNKFRVTPPYNMDNWDQVIIFPKLP